MSDKTNEFKNLKEIDNNKDEIMFYKIGKTVILYKNGKIYEGDVKNGVPNGIGRMWDLREEYVGEFRDGKPHGMGVLISYEYHEKYAGEWIRGKKEGHGIYIDSSYDDPSIDYGLWIDDREYGCGIKFWNNGEKYICGWNGKKNKFQSLKEFEKSYNDLLQKSKTVEISNGQFDVDPDTGGQ